MAMGLMHARVGSDQEDWQIESTGIWAQPGVPPAQNTLEVLRVRGVDLSDYRSRPITTEMVQDFNLILTMERNHREALRSAFPQYRGKIFMLSEMINQMDDVVDPIGGPLTGFEETAREIETILDKGYGRIQRLAAGQYPA
jgi:protein-tyrosine-phosphatase